jgi:hypothetical protein
MPRASTYREQSYPGSLYQFRAMGFPYQDAFVFFPACYPSRVANLTPQGRNLRV